MFTTLLKNKVMKTKSLALVFALFCMGPLSLSAQESGEILYSEDVCNASLENETQNLSFKLEKGSLFITGKIISNCCGSHFLEYVIYNDSIFLSRIDKGELCDCYCLFDIDIEIENCLSDFYKIKLADYSGDDGLETEVYNNQSRLNDLTEKDIKYYFSLTEKQIIIKLSNYKFEQFILYDTFGNIVKKIEKIDSDTLVIDTRNITSGMYIFRLFKANEIILTKKIIIL